MRKPENLDSICETKEIQLFTLGQILYCFKFNCAVFILFIKQGVGNRLVKSALTKLRDIMKQLFNVIYTILLPSAVNIFDMDS